MEPRNSTTGYQPRSKYQTIMRVMTTGLYTLVENEGGEDYGTFPSTLTMESLYVGKYFVGNVMTTPLYVTRGASRPFLYAEDGDNFWRNNLEVSRDRVDRALLNVPTFDYNQIGAEEILQDAGKTSFRNKTKAAPLMNHWGMLLLMSGTRRLSVRLRIGLTMKSIMPLLSCLVILDRSKIVSMALQMGLRAISG